MKKDSKVVQLKPNKEPIEGQIVPQHTFLTHVSFEFAPESEDDWTEDMPEFEIEMDIIGQTEDDDLVTAWNVRFHAPSLVALEARYEALVELTGFGKVDEDELSQQIAFPILAEFSLLLATLSKQATGLPYVMGPIELYDLAWGLEDVDDDF